MEPCTPWITAADLCDVDAPPATVAYEVDVALEWANDRTCARWPGECETVIRPILTPCAPRPRRNAWYRLDLTQWVTGPVTAVEVVVDGEVVPEAHYEVTNGRWLTALAPEDDDAMLIPWPTQTMTRPDGSAGTWSITVTHGEAPPAPVVEATKLLAAQLIERACGRECDLPDNATSVSRQGVTVSLAARTEGKIGLPLVDAIFDDYGCTGGRRTRRLIDPTTPLAAVSRT